MGGHSVRPQKIACLTNEVFEGHWWNHLVEQEKK